MAKLNVRLLGPALLTMAAGQAQGRLLGEQQGLQRQQAEQAMMLRQAGLDQQKRAFEAEQDYRAQNLGLQRDELDARITDQAEGRRLQGLTLEDKRLQDAWSGIDDQNRLLSGKPGYGTDENLGILQRNANARAKGARPTDLRDLTGIPMPFPTYGPARTILRAPKVDPNVAKSYMASRANLEKVRTTPGFRETMSPEEQAVFDTTFNVAMTADLTSPEGMAAFERASSSLSPYLGRARAMTEAQVASQHSRNRDAVTRSFGARSPSVENILSNISAQSAFAKEHGLEDEWASDELDPTPRKVQRTAKLGAREKGAIAKVPILGPYAAMADSLPYEGDETPAEVRIRRLAEIHRMMPKDQANAKAAAAVRKEGRGLLVGALKSGNIQDLEAWTRQMSELSRDDGLGINWKIFSNDKRLTPAQQAQANRFALSHDLAKKNYDLAVQRFNKSLTDAKVAGKDPAIEVIKARVSQISQAMKELETDRAKKLGEYGVVDEKVYSDAIANLNAEHARLLEQLQSLRMGQDVDVRSVGRGFSPSTATPIAPGAGKALTAPPAATSGRAKPNRAQAKAYLKGKYPSMTPAQIEQALKSQGL